MTRSAAPVPAAGDGLSDADVIWGVTARHESRWPPAGAVLVALVLYVVLPDRLVIGPRYVIPALEVALAVPLALANPTRLTRESRDLRWLSVSLTVLIAAANIYSLVRLVELLLHPHPHAQLPGRQLLYAAVLLWLTNVIVFSLWYWELDRGGPVARCQPGHRHADFLFPQMNTVGVAERSWTPGYVDYLYVSFTNATAFSPTDTMPLTRSAKGLMLVQSTVSFVTVALVAARAVNILS